MELMEFADIKKLAKAALRKSDLTFSVNGKEEHYGKDAIDSVLREQFNILAGNYNLMRRNKVSVFELIEETIDEVLPNKVMQQYEQFADVKTIPQGDQAVFRLRVTEASRKRAKAFVTRVGLAGRYETAMLEGKQLTVQTSAVGYGIRIGFEEFLDGRYSFADFTDIMLEGLNDFIYQEIALALASALEELPTANKYSGAGFDEGVMDQLLAISDSYGNGPSTIYCTREFAGLMLPQDKYMSNNMKDTLWQKGYLGDYKGHDVIILQQSVVDAQNTQKVIDPSRAYIFANVGEKPVKIAFEGETKVRTIEDNDDWSTDMQVYKKLGVAIFTNPSICSYENTELTKATRN